MSGIEWLLAAKILEAVLAGILIPGAIWLWRLYGKRVKNDQIRQAVDDAVRAAEELKASGQLKIASKQDYVWQALLNRWPELGKRRDEIEILIHAAINYAEIGAAAKE